MFKRVGAFGAMGAVVAVVVATTLSGTASARIAAAASTVSCTSPVAIGFAYPQTGPVAGAGAEQYHWALTAVGKWNSSHVSPKIKLVPGDTQLAGNNPQATQVAHAFASNSSIVAVSGPAGSQEQEQTAAIWKGAGLAPISGSESRIALTRATTNPNHARETYPGYFFRTVPNDGQQGGNVAAYINGTLHKTSVLIIDDEESYSTGLATQVSKNLKADHVTVHTNHISQSLTDFTGVIASIPAGTQLIYIPWQEAPQAQNFYTQLHNKGKTIPLFGSDGTDNPSQFHGAGSYVSGFPYDPANATVTAFANAHGHDAQSFGVPSYTSVLVNATAIKAECTAHSNHITRGEVRLEIPKVHLTATQSLLGFAVSFLTQNAGEFQGPGDMGGSAAYGIYKIQSNGSYRRVG